MRPQDQSKKSEEKHARTATLTRLPAPGRRLCRCQSRRAAHRCPGPRRLSWRTSISVGLFHTLRRTVDARLPGPLSLRPSGSPLPCHDAMRSLRSTREGNFETHTNRACCRGFASFGGLVGGVSLGLPRRRHRLGRLRAQLLRHRCQAHRAASMRELQPDPCLHHPLVSPRRMKPADCLRRQLNGREFKHGLVRQ